MFECPKKFQTTSKSDFTSFYIGLLIFYESPNFSDFYHWPIKFISQKVPDKEDMDRVAEQLGLRGKLNDSKINEFWVNLQKEPKTGQWQWNNATDNVLKYTNSNFGQWAMLKGKVTRRP